MKTLFIISVVMTFACTTEMAYRYISNSDGRTQSIVVDDSTDYPLSDYHNDVVDYWTKKYSQQYNVPESLMISIFYQESRFERNNPKYNAHVEGDGGRSFGAGQVQIPTAKSVWRDSNLVITSRELKYNIRFNVETATKLVALLRDKYKDVYKTEKEMWLAVLTTYNSGKPKRFNAYAFEVYNRANI